MRDEATSRHFGSRNLHASRRPSRGPPSPLPIPKSRVFRICPSVEALFPWAVGWPEPWTPDDPSQFSDGIPTCSLSLTPPWCFRTRVGTTLPSLGLG